MRFWITLFLILLIATFTVRLTYPPHSDQTSITDTIFSHNSNIHYTLSEIDPRFNLSSEKAKKIAQEAAGIWQRGLNKELFTYDENAKLSINFVYDERQAESDARQQELKVLENIKQYTDAEHESLEKIKQELDQSLEELDQYKAQYKDKVNQYNQLVKDINQSPQQYNQTFKQKIQQQKITLQQEQHQLESQIDGFNQKVTNLNQKISQLNEVSNQYNQSVGAFNQRFQPRPFHKGIFNGSEINIYQFQSDDDLRLTIAHELGHALGMSHSDDPYSLMYPELKKQKMHDFELTKADIMLFHSKND